MLKVGEKKYDDLLDIEQIKFTATVGQNTNVWNTVAHAIKHNLIVSNASITKNVIRIVYFFMAQ